MYYYIKILTYFGEKKKAPIRSLSSYQNRMELNRSKGVLGIEI